MVEGFYEDATRAFENAKANQEKLDKSYDEILANMMEYDVQLVDNVDFRFWIYRDFNGQVVTKTEE